MARAVLLVSLMEPCTTVDMNSPWTVDPATTTMPTPRLTQRYQTTTTSPLSPAIRLSLCSHQVPATWFAPVWKRLFSAGDGSPARPREPVTSLPSVARRSSPREHLRRPRAFLAGCRRNAGTGEGYLSALSLGAADSFSIAEVHRRKCVFLLRDLAAAADLPPHSALFSQQLMDLTHRWRTEREDPDIDINDVQPLAAAVYVHIKLHSARYPVVERAL